VHEINDLCWGTLFRRFDLLARLLFLQKLLERIFVLVLKFLRPKVSRFCFDDVRGQLQHVLWNLFVWDVLEILFLFAHFVRISKRHTEEALTARFERDDVLARGEDNSSKRHHAFLSDRLAYDGERLLTHVAIRNEVVRAV